MKKLMFAAAAIATGVAVADVTSANIVGYATEELKEGNQCVSAQFVRIGAVEGKRGVYLTELQFDFGSVTKVNGDLKIQRLNKDGYANETYQYFSNQGSRSKYKVDGWYDMSDDTLITKDNDVFFPAGEGFFMGGNDAYKLTSSGEVLTGDVTTIYEEDGNMVLANPFPVPLKLLDIVLDVNGASKVNGDLKIQRLNKDGYAIETYQYFTNQGSRSKYKIDGWYDMATDTLMTTENQPTFKAGEALFFGGKTGYKVTFKAPTL